MATVTVWVGAQALTRIDLSLLTALLEPAPRVVLLTALQNALRLEDFSGQALNVVTGALLVLSVLLPNIATSIRSNWQRRKLRQAAAQ